MGFPEDAEVVAVVGLLMRSALRALYDVADQEACGRSVPESVGSA